MRTGIVTGAGSGLGKASAEALSQMGWAVWCADVQTSEGTADAIRSTGGVAQGRIVDVSDRGAVDELISEVYATQKQLDAMCNIAGVMVDGNILDLLDEDLDAVFAVNLKGVLYGCQAAGRIMVEQGQGSIVNMTSTAALAPAPSIGAYAMSKAAVLQLTRSLATEIAAKGVRVNAVAPGFVETTMTSRYWRGTDGTVDGERKEQVLRPMRKMTPMGRLGEPAEVAACVAWLASDASSMLTGQCICPNGGVLMH